MLAVKGHFEVGLPLGCVRMFVYRVFITRRLPSELAVPFVPLLKNVFLVFG